MRIVLVLGICGSGLSLLSQALARLGLPTAGPEDSARIGETQAGLLEALGRRPTRAEGAHALPPGWTESEPARAALGRLRSIVGARLDAARHDAILADGGFAWALADGHAAPLLPLWNRLWAERGITPTYLLLVRDPAAVAATLDRQAGMPRRRGELLWLRHNAAALKHGGDALRRVVAYEHLAARPEATLRGIATALGLDTARAAIDAAAALVDGARGMRHADDVEHGGIALARRLHDQFLNHPPHLLPDIGGIASQVEDAFDMLDAGLVGAPVLGIDGALSLPALLPDPDAGAMWLSPGPLAVTIRNGNNWTRAQNDAIYLHANSPKAPPIELAYEGVKLAGRSTFTAEVSMPGAASHAALLTLRVEAGNGAVICDSTATLPPGTRTAWQVPFGAQGVIGRLKLSVRMADGAANNWHGQVRIGRPRLE